jgi:Tol biopolymer transport system component
MGIREDGFYVFDLDKKNLQKVWHFGEPADIGMKIVVSPNGKYLAWIAPRAQEVYLFQIQSLAPASMEPYKIVSAQASWGVFSPDSKKLALVEVSLDARGKVNGNWLTFYDLETNEKTIISGITRVNSELVFLSDWR